MIKISDFQLAHAFLREICRQAGVGFVDLEISFAEPAGLRDNVLHIASTKNLGHTTYRIFEQYVQNDYLLYDDAVLRNVSDDTFVYLATALRKMVFSGDVLNLSKPEKAVASRLYQRPLVWLLMKDLICPVSKFDLQNVKLVVDCSPFVDIAHYFAPGACSADDESNETFIFVNADIENSPVQNAFLLVETIRAHDRCPVSTLQPILSSPLADKIVGMAELAWPDQSEKVEEFLSVLFLLLDLSWQNYPHVWHSLDADNFAMAKGNRMVKTSQISQDHPIMWWYLGLYEKMLEPARGSDWSTHNTLEPYIQQFWDKVEKVRNEEQGADGVPFEMLLRLKQPQTDSNKTDTRMTIQGLLSDERIW